MALAAYALTDLDAVKAFLRVEHDALDPVLEGLVNAASRYALDRSGREFVSTAAVGEARRFGYDGGRLVTFAPFDLRAGEAVTITVDPDGELGDPNVLAAGTFRLKPVEAVHGVYDRILLDREYGVGALGGIVEIEGTWGWATVPADVVEAVHRIVDSVFDRDLAIASEEFDSPGSLDGQADRIPFDVIDTLESYHRGPHAIGV